jgi:DNA polymerase-3 subunit delta
VLYLVSGKEEFLREDFLQQLKTLMRKLPAGEHNIEELGPGTDVRDVLAACDVVPFLCEKRMVITRGLLSGTSRGRGRTRRASTSAPAETPLSTLLDYLPHLPASTHLVLAEEDASTLKEVLDAHPEAVKRDFPRLRDDALPRWIAERVARHQSRISPRAAAELAQLVGPELRTLDAEIEKLVAYVNAGDAIDVGDVQTLVSGAGPDIFALHDAVAERRPVAALAAAHSLMERGDDPTELLAQLAGLVRRLLVVKELTAERRPLTREAPTFGVTSSQYLLQKLQRQSARLSLADLEQAYATLAEADLLIKSGQLNPELVIELVVAALVGATPDQIASGSTSGVGWKSDDLPYDVER